jgi:hypothetical protein
MKRRCKWKRLIQLIKEKERELMEYAMILALITVAIITPIVVLGDNASASYINATSAVLK